MVRRFIGATRCSIWEHQPESKSLARIASIGTEGEAETRAVLPDENSIEGWVVRNNMMFSVKMLLANEPLAKLDTGRNIMTLPITAGKRIWGVLNIEEMPFVKYNLYSERLLLLIMALAGPALERAIEYDSLVRQEDIHPLTGIPSFSQFYAMLQRELGRLTVESGTLAVLVLELLNFGALVEEFGKEQVFALMRDLAHLAQELSGSQARLFHYKAEPQLALLYPNLDADGASLFSLTLLEKANAAQWKTRDARAFIELILGFSARSGAEQSADDLLVAAENLLEMQKV
jgi:GGDEF domain-containing protein